MLIALIVLALRMHKNGLRREDMLIAAMLVVALLVSIWQVRGIALLAAACLRAAGDLDRRMAPSCRDPAGHRLVAETCRRLACLVPCHLDAGARSVSGSLLASSQDPRKARTRRGDLLQGRRLIPSLPAMPAEHVLVISNLGAPMLRYTPHRVLAGPYHRNLEGNLAALNTFIEPPAKAANIARANGIGLLAFCRGNRETEFLAKKAPEGLLAAMRCRQRAGLAGAGAGKPGQAARTLQRPAAPPRSLPTLFRRLTPRKHSGISFNALERFLDTFPKRFAGELLCKVQNASRTEMRPVFANGYTGRESPELAFTDPLTGLGNHRRFYDKVDRLISDRADDPAPFAIGILDLDGFKPINDLFGGRAGDDILGPGRHAAARVDGCAFRR